MPIVVIWWYDRPGLASLVSPSLQSFPRAHSKLRLLPDTWCLEREGGRKVERMAISSPVSRAFLAPSSPVMYSWLWNLLLRTEAAMVETGSRLWRVPSVAGPEVECRLVCRSRTLDPTSHITQSPLPIPHLLHSPGISKRQTLRMNIVLDYKWS